MKFYFALFALLVYSSTSIAQTQYSNGCYVASERAIYLIIGGRCSVGYQDCNVSTTGNYVVIRNPSTIPCTTCTGLGSPAKSGTLADLTVIRCPLDEYIWLLILSLGTIGFYLMRKRSLLSLATI